MVSDVRARLRARLRRRRGRLGDTWYLDEVFVKIQGRLQYLWRAGDEDGDVIDILVQSRCNRRADIRFFRKLLKGQGCGPRRLITDKLRSYPAACRTVALLHEDRFVQQRWRTCARAAPSLTGRLLGVNWSFTSCVGPLSGCFCLASGTSSGRSWAASWGIARASDDSCNNAAFGRRVLAGAGSGGDRGWRGRGGSREYEMFEI